jgi:hypothetical protein
VPNLTREELLALLDCPAKLASTPPPPASTSKKPEACERFTPLHALIGNALPRLWHYALNKMPDANSRLKHKKLRELLIWLLEKNGYFTKEGANTPFMDKGREVRGKIDLLVTDSKGVPFLAIETDWTRQTASVKKLKVWHDRGVPVLWVYGQPMPPADLPELRQFADEAGGPLTVKWLPLFQLDHGWVGPARRYIRREPKPAFKKNSSQPR